MRAGPGSTNPTGIFEIAEGTNPDGTFSGLIALLDGSITTQIAALKAKAPYSWANAAARAAQTGMTNAEKGTQRDTGVVYRYNSTTALWVAWDSDWITYVPALANIAIGTTGAALLSASYKYEGGRVRVRGVATLGNTGFSVSGNPTIDLPVNAKAVRHPFQNYPGQSTCYDLSAGLEYAGVVTANNSTITNFLILLFGTNGVRQGLSAAIPFTWAAGDSLSWDFTYDPA